MIRITREKSIHRQLAITLIYPFFFLLLIYYTRAFWHDQFAWGFSTPQPGKTSPNTFDSAAPRTYSIICISSESCLGSIVGFARLPCFDTLCSTISAKVALGELLRLCLGSAGLSTSVEKAQTDCHDKARDWSLFERFQVPKYLRRLERGVGFVRLKGVYSAPNSAFRILGASPKFKIIEFYG